VANSAIFLDRDGTLIEDVGYPSRPEHIRILAGVARALVRLAGAGYKLVVVTNQSGIARGILTEDDLNRFHQALDEQLELLGARLDAYYSCPHHPDPAAAVRADLAVECDCRKPRPGLILQAAQDIQIDLAASWTVGDKWRDIACGQAAGTRTIKLPSAATGDDPRPLHVEPPTAEVADLDGAAMFILPRRPSRNRPRQSLLLRRNRSPLWSLPSRPRRLSRSRRRKRRA
jgi:D-glycero-D-manno-heptose 1,7-bisphosphate phosphatase